MYQFVVLFGFEELLLPRTNSVARNYFAHIIHYCNIYTLPNEKAKGQNEQIKKGFVFETKENI